MNIDFQYKVDLNPIINSLRDQKSFSPLLKTEFFDPPKGLEGHLCPGVNILGKVCNIDAPFGTSDRRLLTYE